MKLAFVIHNEYFSRQVLKLLEDSGIDYYTRWEHATGKGHGTEPHLGERGHASTNAVMMIAFREDAPFEKLVAGINAANAVIKRPDDKIRLFEVPLEKIV